MSADRRSKKSLYEPELRDLIEVDSSSIYDDTTHRRHRSSARHFDRPATAVTINDERPKSRSSSRPFEQYLSQQSLLIKSLANFYAQFPTPSYSSKSMAISLRQSLHTPASFKSFGDELNVRIYEQKRKYYPDSTTRRKSRQSLSAGYSEIMQTPSEYM